MRIMIIFVLIFLLMLSSAQSLNKLSSNGFYANLKKSRIHASPAEIKSSLESLVDQRRSVVRTIMKSAIIASTIQATKKPAKATDVQVTNMDEAATSLTCKTDEICKRPSDDRQYRALTLNNKMRILLVSDPSASRAAAAMDIHVGSLNDPINVPGIAHFCEHMLFLGTKAYPDENDFSKFLSSNGGSSNAYTNQEDTVYYFDCSAGSLKPALSRFSQFFISPLFTSSATSRELNAIDSEHSKNINNDGFRMYQLDKNAANPNHPLNRFATGNKYTLEEVPKKDNIDIRSTLLDFHSTFYSANLMTLCILGKQSLSELESFVTSYFNDVPNNQQPDPSSQWWGKIRPYTPQLYASLLEIVPISESRVMSISWPIWILSPEQKTRNRRVKPEEVITHLLGHEGDGSIRSYLVKKGWVNNVNSAISEDISDFQFFEVIVDLTEEGLAHRDEIIDVIFAYIRIIIEEGIPQYIFDEVRQQEKISFLFAEKSDPTNYVSSLVVDMQQYPNPSEYLTAPLMSLDPDGGDAMNYVKMLIPSQAHIKVISTTFKNKTNLKEKWYGTEYNNITLAKQTEAWERTLFAGSSSSSARKYPLHLPPPNELIPTNFALISPTLTPVQRKDLLDTPPVKIEQSERWTLWYKLDRSFLQPKVYAAFTLSVPLELYNPAFVVHSKLFASCFLDAQTAFLYDASLAGLGFDIDFTSRGVQIVISGFNDKFQLFTERMLKLLTEFKPNESTFLRFKDILLRETKSWRTQQPYSHATYYANLATETLQYPIDVMEETVIQAKIEDIQNFLSKSLKKSYGTALIMGNINEKNSKDLLQLVDRVFNFQLLEPEFRVRRRISKFPLSPLASKEGNEAGYLLTHIEPNEKDSNSACTFYFQLPSKKIEDYILLEILAEAIEQPFYDELRTKQQLGYIVFSGIKNMEGYKVLVLTVQSSIVDGPELTKRVESFISTIINDLLKISVRELNEFKNGIIARKLEPDQRLTSQASRFWNEIIASASSASSISAITTSANSSLGIVNSSSDTDELPLFSRHQLEANAIKKVTPQNFKDFLVKLLSRDGSLRRLIISEISSPNINRLVDVLLADNSNINSGSVMAYKKVDDELELRNLLPVLP